MRRVYSVYYEGGSCCDWLSDELVPSSDWLIEAAVFTDRLDECGKAELLSSLIFHFGLPMSLEETDLIVAETYKTNTNGKRVV